jgi:hypothetical protein
MPPRSLPNFRKVTVEFFVGPDIEGKETFETSLEWALNNHVLEPGEGWRIIDYEEERLSDAA